MQTPKPLLLSLCLVCAGLSAYAQNNFQNLGFESASVTSLPAGQSGGFVSSASALPGWTIYLGTNQYTSVLQNDFTLGTVNVSILSPHWTTSMGGGFVGGIIEGNYSVVLQAGDLGIQHFLDASISQTGLVPSHAQSVQVKVFGIGGSGLTVRFAGQSLPLVALGTGSGYTLYGADISLFAGQAGALTLIASTTPVHYNTIELDSIVFSPQQIPEPSCIALFGVGALLLGFFRRRNSLR